MAKRKLIEGIEFGFVTHPAIPENATWFDRPLTSSRLSHYHDSLYPTHVSLGRLNGALPCVHFFLLSYIFYHNLSVILLGNKWIKYAILSHLCSIRHTNKSVNINL